MSQPTSFGPKGKSSSAASMTVLQSYPVKISGEGLFGGQKLGVSDIETKLTIRRPKTRAGSRALHRLPSCRFE
jgi:hypothetical protein